MFIFPESELIIIAIMYVIYLAFKLVCKHFVSILYTKESRPARSHDLQITNAGINNIEPECFFITHKMVVYG